VHALLLAELDERVVAEVGLHLNLRRRHVRGERGKLTYGAADSGREATCVPSC
jgi:hypothetical protein